MPADTLPSTEADAPPPPVDDPPRPADVRFRTPTLLQMEAVECGAACLGILLSYYGRYVPLEQLRLDCGVSRDGSKAINMVKAARRYGLRAQGSKQELPAVFQMTHPLILFWNFNHFVVLEGFHQGRVFLNDPATGPRTISLDELDVAFTGVVLEVEPGADFQVTNEQPSLWPALLRRLANSRAAFAYVLLCTLLLVVPGLVIPTFSRIFVDEYLIGGHEDWVRPLLLGMSLTAILRMIVSYLRDYYLLKFETKLSLTSSSHFLAHVLRLPIEFFGQRYGGEIGSRVLINDRVANLLAAKLGPTALDLVLVVFYALLLMWYDVWLTFACVALSLINILALRLLGRQRVDSSRRLLQEKGKLTGTAMGGLQMIETLKATGGESDFFSRWAGYQAKSLMAQQDLGVTTQVLTVVPPLVNTITTTVILGLGGLRVMDGHLTMGMLVAFQSLMSSFTRPINNLVTFGSSMQELEGNMNRLDDVLRYPQDPRFARAVERRKAEADARDAEQKNALQEDATPADGAEIEPRAERAPSATEPPRFNEETMASVLLGTIRNGWEAAREFILAATPQEERVDSDEVFRRVAIDEEEVAEIESPDVVPPVSGPGTNGTSSVVLEEAAPLAVATPPLQIPKLTGLVELRAVSFGYNPLEKPLIEDLSLTIRPGQRVALIGGSGSGKSTVAKLVAGLYRPRSGQILFDSVPREEISNRLLSGSVGAVDQEVFFFEGTIRDNLTMWDATIPEVDLTAAVRDACIADLINSRPQGMLSKVEEGGGNFSGGQRQRLEIARALVTRPTFLILDEATSALDPTTEQQIDANLRRLGCACLIVAHRLSTIRDADEILVMEKGHVVQRGTHEQMKDQAGPYASLISQH